MKLFCDFHLHSRFSRATSREMDLPNIDKWARLKGINVIGTGDFTHPEWFAHLKEELEPAEPGLFKLKERFRLKNNHFFSAQSAFGPRFILTTEISSIYSKGGKVRKIHNIIFAPDFKTVEKINAQLGWIGNLKSDGRPILGLDAKELLKIVLDASPNCLLVPAHAWTPWFSIFGSRSGFDSLSECFEEMADYIYAIETGLSSDPPMNWRLSSLDHITLISNSDAHSPRKLGREANILETELSYEAIIDTIKKGDPQSFLGTIEFFPQEGKYHFDGHRACGIRLSPEETRKYKGICPKCGRPLTVGVMYRVEELADRPAGEKPEGKPGFKSLIPLEEIIADALGQGTASKAVAREYHSLLKTFGSEFKVLLETDISQIRASSSPEIAQAIERVREGKVKIEPGYDGTYGEIKIFDGQQRQEISSQKSLF